MQKLPVVICIDRAGIVGEDGETHQGVFDISFLSNIPNISIFAPKSAKELEEVLKFSKDYDSPLVIRYPKGEAKIYEDIESQSQKIEYGKSEIVAEGKDITIVAVGNMFEYCYKALKELNIQGISVELINARFIKPVDSKTIIDSVNKTRKILIVEDNLKIGGYGYMVMDVLNESKLKDYKLEIKAYPDEYIKQGSRSILYNVYGLDELGIVNTVLNMLKE
jgi:1-deoxy-D-xylulose-5-phosphate synthase